MVVVIIMIIIIIHVVFILIYQYYYYHHNYFLSVSHMHTFRLVSHGVEMQFYLLLLNNEN